MNDRKSTWFDIDAPANARVSKGASAKSSGAPAARKGAKRRKGRKRSQRSPLVALVIVAALLVGAGAFAVFCLHPYRGETAWVYIPGGSDAEAVGDSVESALGSGEARRVMWLWRLSGAKASTARGAYRIDPGTSSLTIARRLRAGRQTPVKVTFNNVRTLDELARRLDRIMAFSAEEFIQACGRILPEHGFSDRRQYVAAFLPDTYEAYWTDSADKMVGRLLESRNRFWSDERRAKASALGITPVQAATIASIVEEETAKADERPTVARLYLNRLNKGMKLQADPTVKFATGDFTLRRIMRKHLATESPYNTYLHAGLPPGPIRIATAATIDGVLDAPRNNFIYMCAREDFSGYHNFAADYATHQANAARYQRELNKRHIK